MSDKKTTMIPLYVLEVLKKYSSEDKYLTQTEIKEILETEYDVHIADERPVQRALESLRVAGEEEGFPFEIVTMKGRNGGSYILSPYGFSDDDLNLILNLVSDSKLFSNKKKRDLTEGISNLGSSNIKKDIGTIDNAFNRKGTFYINSDRIRNAIDKKCNISFDYYRYNKDKELDETSKKSHIVSPYKQIYRNEKLYLIGYDCDTGSKKGVVNYRVDHMKNVSLIKGSKIIDIKTCKSYENGLTDTRINQMLNNITDVPKEIVFKCNEYLLDQMIDIFGESLKIQPKQNKEYLCTVTTSPLGFRFLVGQFRYELEVTHPQALIKDIRKDIEAAVERYKVDIK